jgi:hypothetical protein
MFGASIEKLFFRERRDKIAGAILDGECRPEGLGAGTGPSNTSM